MRASFLVVVLAYAASAETPPAAFTISTIAGTGGDGDGGPATSALIGNIQGVATDRAGNLYLSDTDNHRVRKIDSNGLITLFAGTGLAGFGGDGGPASKASLNLPYGLAVDGAGNLYVADLGNNRVRRIAPDGTITTVAGIGLSGSAGDGGPATEAQLNAPRNLAVDATGNLYISEFAGHRIRKMSPDSRIVTVAGTGFAGFSGDQGSATAARLAYPAGLALDSHGTLYIADSQNQRIRMVQPDGVITTLLGGNAATSLLTPVGLAIDSAGTIYIADHGSIVRAYTTGGVWQNFAGTGAGGFAGDGGPAVAAELASPHDVAVDAGGRLYIADGARLRRVSATGIIQTVAGDPETNALGDGGDADRAPLIHPAAVALDNAGNLYVAEAGANRVRKVSGSGQISTLAGTGIAGGSGDGGRAIAAQLNSPSGIAVDAFGNVLIGDTNNHRIRRIGADGSISTVIGTGASGIGPDGLPGNQTPLRSPEGVCADHTGLVFVVDTGNRRVLRVAPGANAIVTVAGAGSAGQFKQPNACAVDVMGNVFISDALDNRVFRVTPSGAISIVVGNGGQGFGGDGQPAISALLNAPSGIAVSGDGSLLLADTGNNRIRMVTADGLIQTIAGGDGARLNAPGGLATDGTGSIYFAETGSNLIRRLTPAAAADTAALPSVSIVNAISLMPGPVAPGEVVTISGSGLGPDTGVAGIFDATGRMATALGGTQVQFDGVVAPMFYAQAGQINVQVPYTVAQAQTTRVQVEFNGQSVGSATVGVAAAAPALFPMATNVDGSVNSAANPAPPHTVFTLFGTGEGLTDGANIAGQAATVPYAQPQLPVSLTVSGIPAQVLSARSAAGMAGVLEISARLPDGFLPSGQAPVVWTIGGASSPPITIWLK